MPSLGNCHAGAKWKWPPKWRLKFWFLSGVFFFYSRSRRIIPTGIDFGGAGWRTSGMRAILRVGMLSLFVVGKTFLQTDFWFWLRFRSWCFTHFLEDVLPAVSCKEQGFATKVDESEQITFRRGKENILYMYTYVMYVLIYFMKKERERDGEKEGERININLPICKTFKPSHPSASLCFC